MTTADHNTPGQPDSNFPLLYGHDEEQYIVAVRHTTNSSMRIYSRETGRVTWRDVNFYPFFYLTEDTYLQNFPHRYWNKELGGANPFRHLSAFTGWSELWDAIRSIMELYNSTHVPKISVYTELPVLLFRNDPVHQFLLQSGKTLFKGMKFSDLRRMQVHATVETTAGGKDPDGAGSKVIAIGLADNSGWEKVLSAHRSTEKDLLAQFVHTLIDRDPDIIETSAPHQTGLPFLFGRCEQLGVDCPVGRDQSAPYLPEGRSMLITDRIAGEYPALEIAGRHCIDLHQMRARVHPRSNEGILLPDTIHPGVTGQAQVEPPGLWENNRESILQRSAEATREIRSQTESVGPGFFEIARMLPYPFTVSARTAGTAAIDSLILREYLRLRRSVPHPPVTGPVRGKEPESFYTGLHEPVLRLEFDNLAAALYSALRSDQPEGTGDILFRTISGLLALKGDRAAGNLPVEPVRRLLDSLLPYLSSGRSLLGDVATAQRIQDEAKRIIDDLAATANRRGATVIHTDENGLFIHPPKQLSDSEIQERFVCSLVQDIPGMAGCLIRGRYPAMLIVRNDQYAIRSTDNRILLHGQALMARSLERFGRNFLHHSITAILSRDFRALHDNYVSVHRSISARKLSCDDFSRTETLRETYEEYHAGITAGTRNPAGPYEAAIRAGLTWNSGDRISTYMTGSDALARETDYCVVATEWDPNRPDENTAWYLRRLDEIAGRFGSLFSPEDFHSIFSIDDLFGFSGEGISVLNRSLIRKEPHPEEELFDDHPPGPTIWLDFGEKGEW